MAPRDIPGYYWDAEKGRYFKVESSNTAPQDAAWSSTSFKRRKIEDEESIARLRRADRAKGLIKRSRVLNAPLMGGFLAHEFGGRIPDFDTALFADGIVKKGRVSIDPRRRSTNLRHMLVAADKFGDGWCYAYGSMNDGIVVSDRISRAGEAQLIDNTRSYRRTFDMDVPCADIKHSEKFNRVLVAPARPLDATRPLVTLDPWTLLPMNISHRLGSGYKGLEMDTEGVSCTLGIPPSSSEYVCLVGTTRGVVAVSPQGTFTPISPEGKKYRDVFSIGFCDTKPDIAYFGGRPGWVWAVDMRKGDQTVVNMSVQNAITNVRLIDENNILVASLRNTLAVYDLRNFQFFEPSTATAVMVMDGYKNQARIDIGLDYHKESGIVAAAHDDGKVALYSVRTGRRVPSPDIDAISSRFGAIRCLQFQNFYNDATPSLFVGEGTNVQVYSFGTNSPGDEA